MRINQLQVQQFLTIVRHMNMSRAAKELYISQPALSQSINRLEEELGVELFYREGNKLILSYAGERLLGYFLKLRDTYDRLEAETLLLKREHTDHLTIGFACSPVHFFALYMTDFLAEYDGKVIRKVYAEKDLLLNMLKTEQLDFAIMDFPVEDELIMTSRITCREVVLAVSSGHPLARNDFCKKEDLAGVPLYALPKHNGFRQLCDFLCLQNNLKVNNVHEYNYYDLHRIIEEKRGSDDFAVFCWRDYFPRIYGEGYKCLRISDANMRDSMGISWLGVRKLQYRYKDFIEHITTNMSAQIAFTLEFNSTFFDPANPFYQ